MQPTTSLPITLVLRDEKEIAMAIKIKEDTRRTHVEIYMRGIEAIEKELNHETN